MDQNQKEVVKFVRLSFFASHGCGEHRLSRKT